MTANQFRAAPVAAPFYRLGRVIIVAGTAIGISCFIARDPNTEERRAALRR
jgi:hypothetical protein